MSGAVHCEVKPSRLAPVAWCECDACCLVRLRQWAELKEEEVPREMLAAGNGDDAEAERRETNLEAARATPVVT